MCMLALCGVSFVGVVASRKAMKNNQKTRPKRRAKWQERIYKGGM